MSDLTNKERAARAEAGLTAYSLTTDSLGDFLKDPATVAGDFLADLLHWCDGRGFDFEDMVTQARDHHAEEVEVERERKEARSL